MYAVATFPAPASAQIAPFDDYNRAPSYYAPQAKAGNAQAQFLLGLALEMLGAEAEARWGNAEGWIAKAAASGLADAELRIAQILLAKGDTNTATAFLENAADAGLPEAQFNLGRIAAEAGNPASAQRRYWQAARQGYGPAQFNLALLLVSSGNQAALTDALSWLILASEASVTNAAAARDQVSAALDEPARIAAAKRAAARRR